jgi:peroxiredoxin
MRNGCIGNTAKQVTERGAGAASAWLRCAATAGFGLLVATNSLAGTYNPDRSIGDVVSPWSDLPGTDGRRHAWTDVADRDAVVVVFTCNTCPYAIDYESRIDALAERHAGPQSRVAVVAINANAMAEDALAAMRARAEAKGFSFPYLRDESQAVARDFGAVRTPECFVLDRQRKIVYMGALDDASDAGNVTRHYVDDAVAAVLAGREVEVAETPPVGCLIRFERRRGR